ncbi:unnamed protein product [Camellia sinensis]
MNTIIVGPTSLIMPACRQERIGGSLKHGLLSPLEWVTRAHNWRVFVCGGRSGYAVFWSSSFPGFDSVTPFQALSSYVKRSQSILRTPCNLSD